MNFRPSESTTMKATFTSFRNFFMLLGFRSVYFSISPWIVDSIFYNTLADRVH